MHSITNLHTPLIHQNLNSLLSTLHTPDPNTHATRPTIDSNTRQQLIAAADAIQDLLAKGLTNATQSFPTNALYSRPTHKQRSKMWPKIVKRGITTLRNRSVLLRHLLTLYNTPSHPSATSSTTPTPTGKEAGHIVTLLSNAPTLETILHKPLRSDTTLCLPTKTEDLPTLDSDIIYK